MALNATPASTIEVEFGRRTVVKRACKRCGGTGSESKVGGMAPDCFDCKGYGWREIDNETVSEVEW